MMFPTKTLLLATLVLQYAGARADVFQCFDENGQTIYTDDQSKCVDPKPISLDEQDTAPVETDEPASPGDTPENNENAIAPGIDIVSVWGAAREIDGILTEQEWGHVTPYSGGLTLAFGKEDDLFLYVMNDDEWLYFAIEFKAQKLISNESLFITLDEEFTGSYYEGQDILGLGLRRDGGQIYYDEARTLNPPCVQKAFRSHKVYCAFVDTDMDGTIDGMGRYRFHEQTAVYEFMKPLASEDREFDAQLEPGQLVGLKLRLNATFANYSEVFVPGPTHREYLVLKIAEIPDQSTATSPK